MGVQTIEQGDVTVLKPTGPLTGEESVALRAAGLQVITLGGKMVLDLAATSFVDSKALEAMVELNHQLRRIGQALKICSENDTVRQVLDVTDLAEYFEHFEDSNAALRSF
jgi:anti-anti-sigma factor